MRPQTTAGQGCGLAIGALVVLACAIAPLPAAIASQGATDQYTEEPPSGPAGNESPGNTEQIQTQSPSRGGDRTTSQTAGTPGSQNATPAPSAPATSTPTYSAPSSVPSSSGSSGGTAEKAKPKAAKAHPDASANNGPKPQPVKVGPPEHRGSAGSSDDGDSKLPLVGYPLTTFVAVLLILALVGLAALAAKLSYGRLWGASRSS